jgi:hypothetical protein
MKRALLGLLIGCLTVVFAGAAFAGQNTEAAIAVHIGKKLTVAKGSICDQAPDFFAGGVPKGPELFRVRDANCPPMGDPLNPTVFDVWLVLCGGNDSVGVAGVEYGLEYDYASGSGIDVQNWVSCTDLEFKNPGFPFVPNTGNVQTWDRFNHCQRTSQVTTLGSKQVVVPNSVFAVIGWLRVVVRGSDELSTGPRPITGKMKIADCESKEDDITARIESRGSATFCSNRLGYNPCATSNLAVEDATWGRIKTLFNDGQ